MGLLTKQSLVTGELWEGGAAIKWDLKWIGVESFEFDLWSQIQLPTDTQSNKCKFSVELRPGYHVSDILGIQYSFNGSGEEICIDLLLFIDRHFCRGRQYKNPSTQVWTAAHLAYLGQSIIWIKNLAWITMDEYFESSGENVCDSFLSLNVTRFIKTMSHAGNPAIDYKMCLGRVLVHMWQQSCFPVSTLKAYVGVENVGEGTWSNVLVS